MKRLAALSVAKTVALIAVLASATAAHAAVTITNRDDQEHTILIIEGESRTEHVLKPSQTLTGVCEKGCSLRIDDDDEDDPYLLKPDVSVSIEDGVLYYEPDAPAPQTPAPPKGGGAKGTSG